MKDKIKQLLNEAMQEAKEKSSNHTVRKTKEISISDVSPLELSQFIEENNIPKDCWFSGDGDYNPVLIWEIIVPASEVQKKKELIRKFERLSWYKIRDCFLDKGYKIKSCSVHYTIDELYLNYFKDIDLLVEYYFNRFSF